ncbi:MAG: hypothetical protein ACP5K6_02840 [Dictyoglomus sp.]|uniref:hypothetical protein n=1 Tax=Dictyoglomus sp. TaxID=28205 RepID=UPI003D1335C5
MKSKAIVFRGPFQLEIKEYDLRELEEGKILVKTIYTGVSPDTELRVLSGKQKGEKFLLIPGYENVGKVVEEGKQNIPFCFNYHPTLFDHEIDILVSRDCTYFDLLEGYKKLMKEEIIKAIFKWS